MEMMFCIEVLLCCFLNVKLNEVMRNLIVVDEIIFDWRNLKVNFVGKVLDLMLI